MNIRTFISLLPGNILECAELWSGVMACAWGWASENSVMALPIKKIIYTELFIDKTTDLYKRNNQIKVMTNKGNRKNGILWLKVHICLVLNCQVDIKRCGHERSGDKFRMSLAGLWKNRTLLWEAEQANSLIWAHLTIIFIDFLQLFGYP